MVITFFDHIASHKRPDLAGTLGLPAKGSLSRGDNDTLLVVRNPTSLPFDDPVRIFVPLLERRKIIHACHADASCHLGVTRTLIMLERFYWSIGM